MNRVIRFEELRPAEATLEQLCATKNVLLSGAALPQIQRIRKSRRRLGIYLIHGKAVSGYDCVRLIVPAIFVGKLAAGGHHSPASCYSRRLSGRLLPPYAGSVHGHLLE
jgi:hypothetical protein